ncbi:MAG: double-strand break repair helicase AddA, partial [Novosphingobium sp.]
QDNQRLAVAPEDTVWLSASAGTGKTQVLSSRVLRLLLQEQVEPSQILCLTFTKAGATEMAARINETLARWVRADPVRLAEELRAIGADYSPPVQERARTLFAAVLDCPGGGLRIDTIHAFAQWLLAAFPTEAGLVPGTRPMEDRDRDLLARQVLAQTLLDAEARGDERLLDSLAALSLRMGPDGVERYLLRCASAHELWLGTGAWTPPFLPRVKQLLGIPADADESHLAALCDDAEFDVAALRRCRATLAAWDSATGRDGTEAIDAWLAQDAEVRLLALDDLHLGLFTKTTGAPKQLNNVLKRDPDYEQHVLRVGECIAKVRELRAQLALAAWLTPALELGRAFALAWHEAKQREGLIDFDDQIRQAAALLGRAELGEWIRYKLDRRFDHVLVDEAQDTNAAQWRIIEALTGDFFSGIGARDGKLRTLFVVGDYKQAIFRFQGTSPENFEAARRRVEAQLRGLKEDAENLRLRVPIPRLQELGLATSFRTAQPVLDFVNRAIAHIGHAAFGLAKPPDPHVGEPRPGYVALWRPVGLTGDEEAEVEEAEEGGEGWLSRPDRKLADNIARQIRGWIDEGFPLVKGGARRAGPGDVMILVRKRKELAGLIIARLHAAGVPVAGVDRLRLGAPLAVKDLVAALRFAAQPLDDLNLASLLVSPLIGWSQEQLLEHAYREKGARLWNHLRQSFHPEVLAARELLGDLLRLADFELPQALLHWLLVGPWQGRRKLVARLGREAGDPIDELLNAASAYAASSVASLAGFLAWFDAGEGELKREAGKEGGLVRVMTVHGAKGLQAPIVILADAAGDPAASRGGPLDLPEPERQPGEDPRRVPLPGLRKEEKGARVLAAEAQAAQAEGEEHWRLLYVAMTRAEEALFIGGSLGLREKVPAPESWYARLAELFAEQEPLADDLWGHRFEHGALAPLPPPTGPVEVAVAGSEVADWLHTPPAAEPRPPRPLAPSSLGEDFSPDPPLTPGAGLAAARRGTLIHKLLERLSAVPSETRPAAAQRWLARNAAELDAPAREEIGEAALAVLAEPAWADLFSSAALAEVPLAAVVGGQVVAGTIDRLLIEPDRIRLVDFKTARRPPKNLDEIPSLTLRQLAAYAAALEATYPGRRIEAAVLYTQTPQLIDLPADWIERHKPAQKPPLFPAQ